MKELFRIVAPFIMELVKSAIVPYLKRKSYQRFDDFANDMIEDLEKLKEKALNTDNETKKEAHLTGLKLGSNTLKAIGEKLIKAADMLEAPN